MGVDVWRVAITDKPHGALRIPTTLRIGSTTILITKENVAQPSERSSQDRVHGRFRNDVIAFRLLGFIQYAHVAVAMIAVTVSQ